MALSREYLAYIASPEWKAVRERFAKSHLGKGKRRKCHACGSRKFLDLHHKTYSRFKNERLTDLVWLCRTCHDHVHAYRSAHPKKRLSDVTRLVTHHIRRS